MIPLVESLPNLDAEAAFARLSGRAHCLFLDSARPDFQLGRYSFLTADPFEYFEVPAGAKDGFGKLAELVRKYPAETVPELPPFQGGAAGLFAYELSRQFESVPVPRYDEFQMPALAIGLYDVVLAFDHRSADAWLISQGWPERDSRRRHERAARRLAEFRDWLAGPEVVPPRRGRELHKEQLAPQFVVDPVGRVTSNFPRERYLDAIRRAVDYIHAGDVFQVNLSQRLLCRRSWDAVALYRRLRRRNPAPFAGYFDLGDFQIVSASPERFVRVQAGEVETRPIKGTRPRTARPEADLFAADDLLQSSKDRAENVMIVDLLRNDLSRVCRPESVVVTQLCEIEVYQYVQHLVSAVCGRLEPDCSPVDLIRAAFPGGSITGAPKVRAMEIIAELEPTARGAYCGSLGYLGFDGSLDLNILIRTITAGKGWYQLPVGGGIVAQSEPGSEYQETWDKAKGLLEVLSPR